MYGKKRCLPKQREVGTTIPIQFIGVTDLARAVFSTEEERTFGKQRRGPELINDGVFIQNLELVSDLKHIFITASSKENK